MSKKKQRNFGFVPSYPQVGDYVLGGTTKLGRQELQPDGQWDAFLPSEEFQNMYGTEVMGCVSFGTLNCVEILIRRLYNK